MAEMSQFNSDDKAATAAQENPAKVKLADEMAAARTILAMDRTLLAWIRTALSLIGFGLALVKFLGRSSLHNLSVPRGDAHSIECLGLGVMTCGLAFLLCGAIDYYKAAHKLRMDNFGISVWSRSLIMCLLLSALTIVTIIGIVGELLH
jgi:putative membrane protein